MSKPTTAELVEYLRTQAEAVFDNSSDFECRDMFIAAADRLEAANSEANQYFKEAAEWESKHRGATRYIKELEAGAKRQNEIYHRQRESIKELEAQCDEANGLIVGFVLSDADTPIGEIKRVGNEIVAKLAKAEATIKQVRELKPFVLGDDKTFAVYYDHIQAILDEQP